MFGFKLLCNLRDGTRFRSLNKKVIYILGEWMDVPGNGSYVSMDGTCISDGGISDTLAVFEVEDENEIPRAYYMSVGIKCFKRVKLIDVGEMDLCLRYKTCNLNAKNGIFLRLATYFKQSNAIRNLLLAGGCLHCSLYPNVIYSDDQLNSIVDQCASNIEERAICLSVSKGFYATTNVLIPVSGTHSLCAALSISKEVKYLGLSKLLTDAGAYLPTNL